MEFMEFMLVMEFPGELSGISIASSSDSPLSGIFSRGGMIDFFLADLAGSLRTHKEIFFQIHISRNGDFIKTNKVIQVLVIEISLSRNLKCTSLVWLNFSSSRRLFNLHLKVEVIIA